MSGRAFRVVGVGLRLTAAVARARGPVRSAESVCSVLVELAVWTGWPASSHAVGTPGRGEDERRGSGRLAVFVDEAAEDIETFNAPDPVGAGARNIDGWDGHVKVDAAVRTGGVVVPHVVV